MKQIHAVLNAFVGQGARTTRDAADETGLSLKHCSAYARQLVADGFLLDKGEVPGDRKHGRPSRWYEPQIPQPGHMPRNRPRLRKKR